MRALPVGRDGTRRTLRRLALLAVLAGMLAPTLLLALRSGQASAAVRIVIEVDQRRLTLWEDGKPVRSFPAAVGKAATPTPLGHWTIVSKERWSGGFGTRWLGLSVPWGHYGIHGTNRPWTVGRAVSHGCIRLRNADVEALFELVRVGTPVVIVGTPSRRTVYEGDRGSEVREVQVRLGQLGLYAGAADGVFGPELRRSVERFQARQGLEPDGIVGPATYRALGLMPGG